MTYLLPSELGNQLVNYLAGRPYREVADLIAELVTLKPAAEDEPKPDDS